MPRVALDPGDGGQTPAERRQGLGIRMDSQVAVNLAGTAGSGAEPFAPLPPGQQADRLGGYQVGGGADSHRVAIPWYSRWALSV